MLGVGCGRVDECLDEERQLRIFLVDDSKSNLALLGEMLEANGYQVFTATDGESALRKVQSITPDLILLDIEMPGANGVDVCRLIKRRQDLCDVPIIMMTSLTSLTDKVEAFKAGCVDYITKPLQLEEVKARVDAHLQIRRLQSQLCARNAALEKTNLELKEALDNIETLSGLLPMCASCKSVRDDDGFWQEVEAYLSTHTHAEFSHGICPCCIDKLYPDLGLRSPGR